MKNTGLFFYRTVNAVLDKSLIKLRRSCLNNTDFSIICNNCWAGHVYRRFGLPYQTPTVGLYFFATDFVKFCADVKGYFEKPLEFISYTESKYRDKIEQRGQTNVPLARLGDIEVVFLHYKTREEAEEKWNRRKARVNFNNMIFKFSKMNLCDEEEIRAFDTLEHNKKFCFVPPEEANNYKCAIPFGSAAGCEDVKNDTMEYARYIKLIKVINAKRVCGTNIEGRWTEE